MCHHDNALPRVGGSDSLQFFRDAPLKTRHRLTAGHRRSRTLVQPSHGEPRKLFDHLIPRQPFPSTEVDLAQLRTNHRRDAAPPRDRRRRRRRSGQIAAIDRVDPMVSQIPDESRQLPPAERRERRVSLAQKIALSFGADMTDEHDTARPLFLAAHEMTPVRYTAHSVTWQVAPRQSPVM